MSSLCSSLHFFTSRNDIGEKERGRENYIRRNISAFQNSYDHEIFYTFSPLYLPSIETVSVAKFLCYPLDR